MKLMSSLSPTAGELQSTPQPTTGVLLIQLGTPHEPKPAAVRRFLREFLSDERVIDIAAPLRFFLVNGVIAPFRTPGSTKIYRRLWEIGGGESPIRMHTRALTEQLNERFAEEAVTVHMAMRYQGPSIEEVLEEMRAANYTKLVVLPLFPHYASSSTGTALQRVMEVVSSWWSIPGLELINQFYEEDFYLDTLAQQAQKHDVASFDHVVMSYHGLPVQHVDKVYPKKDDLCEQHSCEDSVEPESALCYKATCFETSRLLAGRLGLSPSDYTVSFQSRLNDRWLTLQRPGTSEFLCSLLPSSRIVSRRWWRWVSNTRNSSSSMAGRKCSSLQAATRSRPGWMVSPPSCGSTALDETRVGLARD
jgi:ferrochelatase